MNATERALLSRLLDTALQLPPERRGAWLDGLGSDCAAVKPRLRALLSRSDQLLDQSAALATLPKLADGSQNGAIARPLPLSAESSVGPYQLLRCLGVGGMGTVWLARDERQPGRPFVALKFAHVAPDRKDFALRLAREQRALSTLQHPNIARLYEAAQTPDGRLYLVLEYIEGLPLDRFCTSRVCDSGLRLGLFVQVADAMTHAHEHRILHRDFKPANVLVTAEGEARLLDFGIAKLLGDTGSQFDLSRMSGCPLTPQYASPEQIAGGEVGFASDIYSLGVMLYELSAGVGPYRYRQGSTRALRDAILRSVPKPPSLAAVDAAVQAQLQGGLDDVILKALEKQPEKRHASMRDFARDLEHQARLLSRRKHGNA